MDTSKYDENEGFKQGLAARREVLGDGYVQPSIEAAADDDFSHDLQQFVTEHCWGTVWCRDGLPRETRSIINLAHAGRNGPFARTQSAPARRHPERRHAGRNQGSVPPGRRLRRRPAAIEGFRCARDVFAEPAA